MFQKNVLYITIAYFVFICHGSLISNCIASSDLPYKEDEVIVRFAPKNDGKQRNTDERNQVLTTFNAGEVKRSTKLVPGLSLVKLPANLTVDDVISKLKGKSETLYVEPNYKIRGTSTPNDQYFSSQWGLAKISAPAADVKRTRDWRGENRIKNG